MTFNLNRSLYFNLNITEDTPGDVIVFLMKTCGNYIEKKDIKNNFSKIRKYLYSFESTIDIKENYNQDDLNKIVLFVSDTDMDWEPNILLSSFRHIIHFKKSNILEDLSREKIGSCSNLYMDKVDICILYFICQKIGIKTTFDDKIDTLYQKIINPLNTIPYILKDIDIDKVKQIERIVSLLKNVEEDKYDKIKETIYKRNQELLFLDPSLGEGKIGIMKNIVESNLDHVKERMILRLLQTEGITEEKYNIIKNVFNIEDVSTYKELIENEEMVSNIKKLDPIKEFLDDILNFEDKYLLKKVLSIDSEILNEISSNKNISLENLNKINRNEEDISLEELSNKINIHYIISNTILTKKEAIIYAGKFFNLDITESHDPIKFLKKVNDSLLNGYDFIVDDLDDFSINFKLNPEYYKLDKFWKKKIKFLYSAKSLQSIKNLEDTENLDEKEEQNNYYYGVIPGADNEFLVDKYNKNVISFGKMKNMKFKVFDIDYLIKNPRIIDFETNMNKLKKICELYNMSYKSIIDIKKFCLVLDENIKEFIDNSGDLETVSRGLFEISQMIKDKEKISDVENLSIMDSNYKIVRLFHSSSQGDKLKKLPLITYEDGRFKKATANYYQTLFEDLSTLQNLHDKNGEFLKSKYKFYAYTSYFYYYQIKKEELFKLN